MTCTTPIGAANRRAPMRAAVSAGWLLVVLTLRAFAATGAETPAVATEARAEMQTFLTRWNDAMAAQDAPAIRASYVDDPRFCWFEDGVLRYRSVEEILRALQQFPPGTRIETSLSNIEGERLASNLIHGSARFRTRVTMPGRSFEYGGVFTLVLERVGPGWRFLRGHTSTLRPEQGR
jgi:ketosteroid isomerase-like protein